MAGIDDKLTFYALRIAVLTVSDSRTEATDKSGALLVDRLTAAGHRRLASDVSRFEQMLEGISRVLALADA